MLFTLSGVTGAGKSTFIKSVLKRYPESTGIVPIQITELPKPHDHTHQFILMNEEEFTENRWHDNFFITTTDSNGVQRGILTSDVESVMSRASIFYCIIETTEIEHFINFAIEKWSHAPAYTKIQSISIYSPGVSELRKRLQQKYGNTIDIDAVIAKESNVDRFAHGCFLDNRYVHFIKNVSTIEAFDTAILNLEFD